jgi:hypothetical protein
MEPGNLSGIFEVPDFSCMRKQFIAFVGKRGGRDALACVFDGDLAWIEIERRSREWSLA